MDIREFLKIGILKLKELEHEMTESLKLMTERKAAHKNMKDQARKTIRELLKGFANEFKNQFITVNISPEELKSIKDEIRNIIPRILLMDLTPEYDLKDADPDKGVESKSYKDIDMYHWTVNDTNTICKNHTAGSKFQIKVSYFTNTLLTYSKIGFVNRKEYGKIKKTLTNLFRDILLML